MFNIYQLYLMNEKKLPFEVKRGSWGNLVISVDKIENIRFSASAWYCDAFTLSESYKDTGYGSVGEYKIIGCAGSYQWGYADPEKEYRPEKLPVVKQHHKNGLTYQKAGKEYNCFFCGGTIHKGFEYEKYSMRNAGGSDLTFSVVFCFGHRDQMREKVFGKPIDKIKFPELIDKWGQGIII